MIVNWFKKEPESLLGLEAGTKALKLVELFPTDKGFRLESFAIVPTPLNAIVNNDFSNPTDIAAAIKAAYRLAHATTKHAAISVIGSSVIIKQMLLDAMLSPADMESQAWVEASKSFPEIIEDISLDFEILGPNPQDPAQVEVLLVACRKEHIESRALAITESGLIPKVVDIDYYAMGRVLEHLAKQYPGESSSEQSMALLNIGASMTTLVVQQGSKLIYFHDQAFDGQRLLDTLHEHFGLVDLFNYQSKPLEKLAQETQSEIKQLIKTNLISHIRHFLQFFYSTRQRAEIHHLILSGECAIIPGIDKTISEFIEVPTSIANPFKDMALSKNVNQATLSQVAPALTLSCGLAMHGKRQ